MSCFSLTTLLLFGAGLTGAVGLSATEPPSLRELGAGRGLLIGTAVKPASLASEPKYREVLLRHFNVITPENAMKMKYLHPALDRWDFGDADAVVAFAQQHRLRVRGHTLVWNGDNHSPAWLLQQPRSRDNAARLMREHISTVMSRYRGRVTDWDVVNEAISNDNRPNASPYARGYWLDAMGPDYIATAFRLAREANPKARLFYNDSDHGEALGPKSDRIYSLLKRLKAEGVPIDGVGLQLHCNLQQPPRPADLIANFQRLAALGLVVYVTELDVEIMTAPGALEARLEQQAVVYRDVFAAAVRSGCVEGVVMWGFTDKFRQTSLLLRHHLPATDDTPMWLFDASYRPKPAFDAVVEVLAQRDTRP